ncbi:ABC transporter substrate-binding protein [Sporosarcina gallistercoris]|uniref:ABC transporter substrate-binding protein n=1 Tax=Sporosarcina gallistercoris TaxID=2762245 RepID=A0ABR8PKA7_9BACL|nr:ABC transporter substrate-binding protein [Sporosarcina gallistercoris]MBD7908594.1 ABC transporter substrate-binding protein [Sporosarcina gallistercoris]
MRKILIGLSIGLLAVLTACGPTEKEEVEKETPVTGENEQVEKTDANTADGVDEKELKDTLAEFPEGSPERIITTSVPLAEMLDLLDVTPVGVPTSTNPLPANFEKIDQIGSPMQPDLEVVTSLTPDLILGAESLRSTLDKSLEGMDLPTAYLPTDSFDDLKLSFKALGTYFDKTEEMDKVLNQLASKENELTEQGKGKELPSALLVIGTADSFMVMNDESYVGSLVKKLGADNIATSVLKVKDRYSPINMEDVVVADPDIILVLASGDHGASEDAFKKEVESNDTWTKLSAYQNDKIEVLDYGVFGVTSIKNAEKALTDISTYFYE